MKRFLVTLTIFMTALFFAVGCDDSSSDDSSGSSTSLGGYGSVTLSANLMNAYTGTKITSDLITNAKIKQGNITREYDSAASLNTLVTVDDSGTVVFLAVNANSDYIIEFTVSGYQTFISSNQALNKTSFIETDTLVYSTGTGDRTNYVFSALLLPTPDVAATTMTVKDSDGSNLIPNTSITISNNSNSILSQLSEKLKDGNTGFLQGNIWLDDSLPKPCGDLCVNDMDGGVVFTGTTDANGQIAIPENILATNGRYILSTFNSAYLTSNSSAEFIAGATTVNVGTYDTSYESNYRMITVIPFNLATGALATVTDAEVSVFQTGNNNITASVGTNGYITVSGIRTSRSMMVTIAPVGYQPFIHFVSTLPANGGTVGAYITPNPDSPAVTLQVRSSINGALITTGTYIVKSTNTTTVYNGTPPAVLDAQWTPNGGGTPVTTVATGTLTDGNIAIAENTLINGRTYDILVYGADGFSNGAFGTYTFVAGNVSNQIAYIAPLSSGLEIIAMGHVSQQGKSVSNSRTLTFTFNQPVAVDFDQTLTQTDLDALIGSGYMGFGMGNTTITYTFDAAFDGDVACELRWQDSVAGYTESPFLLSDNNSWFVTAATDDCVTFGAGATTQNFTRFLDSDLDRMYNYYNPAGNYATPSGIGALPAGLTVTLDAAATTLTITLDAAVDAGLLASDDIDGVSVSASVAAGVNCGASGTLQCYTANTAVLNRVINTTYDAEDDLSYTFRGANSIFDLIKLRRTADGDSDDWTALDDTTVSSTLRTALGMGGNTTMGTNGAGAYDVMIIREAQEN